MNFQWLPSTPDGIVRIAPFNGTLATGCDDAWILSNATRLKIATALVLDVETTGLDPQRDSIIEIGIRQFQYSRVDGTVLRVTDAYDAFQDPGAPLSERITKLTGITDADVAGQVIHASRVADMLAKASLCIAHNASFDRAFVDRFLTRRGVGPIKTAWACSIQQVAWEAHGLPSAKLEALCALHGFYCTAHRAGADAAALLRLLSHRNAVTGQTYLHELLEMSRAPWMLVRAVGAPFESKDVLKERGYSWAATRKVWQRVLCSEAATAEEMKWLAGAVYGRGANRASVTAVDPASRFAEGV
jgi:DNA polymerase-3 subunit epsilon